MPISYINFNMISFYKTVVGTVLEQKNQDTR